MWRYAENCEEPISNIIGLMLLIGQSDYGKPCLLTVIRILGKCFRNGNMMAHL